MTFLVIGLGYGDCGKGSIVDFLVRRMRHLAGDLVVVRFNGGPQAGHNVVTPDSWHHAFSQFGSGTFVPGVRTFLSRFMLIEPYALFNEANHLHDVGVRDAMDRLFIDARCPVITPAHQAANRIRELARGEGAHGTCGLGIGETMQDVISDAASIIRAAELSDRVVVARKLRATRDARVDELRNAIRAVDDHPMARSSIETLEQRGWIDVAVDVYAELAARVTVIGETRAGEFLRDAAYPIFEGAQGVLLDETHGFHPHTTWSTTTFANAETLLAESRRDDARVRVGVLRTYATRHGPGPMVSEDRSLEARLLEPHNVGTGWQGRFRVGPFDAVASRYALRVAGGADMLAITHLDQLDVLPPRICNAYQIGDRQLRDLPQSPSADMLSQCQPVYEPLESGGTDAFLSTVAQELNCRVGIVSHGPDSDSVMDCR